MAGDKGSVSVRALVFDLHGLLIDTEKAAHQSWVELYAAFGQPFPTGDWLAVLGGREGGFDGLATLEDRVGRPLDRVELDARRRRRKRQLAMATSLMPGAEDWVMGAREAGIACAVASNSPADLVQEHLGRLGLDGAFDVVQTSTPTVAAKPAPDVHAAVLERLDVHADVTIAIEDSPSGLQGASAAGLRCIVVPNPLLQPHWCPDAPLVLPSLEAMTVTRAVREVGRRARAPFL